MCVRVPGCRTREGRAVAAADPGSCAGLHLIFGCCCPSGPGRSRNSTSTGEHLPELATARLSPRGEVLRSLGAEPGLLVADLDLDLVEETRAAIPCSPTAGSGAPPLLFSKPAHQPQHAILRWGG